MALEVHKGILSLYCDNFLNSDTNDFINDKGLYFIKNSVENSNVEYILCDSWIEVVRLIMQSKKFSLLVIKIYNY